MEAAEPMMRGEKMKTEPVAVHVGRCFNRSLDNLLHLSAKKGRALCWLRVRLFEIAGPLGGLWR